MPPWWRYLAEADFDNVIRLTPKQASEFKSLLLSDAAHRPPAGGRHLV